MPDRESPDGTTPRAIVDSTKANKRRELLELAEELGSVSSACRKLNLNRSVLYGPSGLQDMRRGRVASNKTSQEVVSKIVCLVIQHPEWGCCKLSEALEQQEGAAPTSPTVQAILVQLSLGRRDERFDLRRRVEERRDAPILKEIYRMVIEQFPDRRSP